MYVQVGVLLASEHLGKKALEARASIGPWKASSKRMNVRFRKPVYIPVMLRKAKSGLQARVVMAGFSGPT